MASKLFEQYSYPWEVLTGLNEYIIELGKSLSLDEYQEIEEHIWVHKSAEIARNTTILPPCIIGAHTQLRHCAFIRGSVMIGEHCVVGNSTELKNSILFDHVQVPHYNYVGDSILGYCAHMGAGSITSNVKSDQSIITIKDKENRINTNFKKLGAIIGDYSEVGCNSVLNPGTVIGRNAIIYPLTSVRGVVPADSIVKSITEIIKRIE